MPATMHYDTKPSIESHNQLPLADHIRTVMSTYYKNLVASGAMPENVYELVISEVELPLIEATMEYTGNNQSNAAKILGVNRGTFRKKLSHYDML
jgi:Fis family transcriptional regulator, factor for inversion stimulation protein